MSIVVTRNVAQNITIGPIEAISKRSGHFRTVYWRVKFYFELIEYNR